MLALMERLPACDDLQQSVLRLRTMALDVTHQLNRWLLSLKETESKGPRHKTASTRETAEKTKRRDNFIKQLEEIR